MRADGRQFPLGVLHQHQQRREGLGHQIRGKLRLSHTPGKERNHDLVMAGKENPKRLPMPHASRLEQFQIGLSDP